LLAAPGRGLAHGDGQLEIARLTSRIADNREDASLYLKRAVLLRNHGLYPAALKDLERVEKINPDEPDLLLEWADLDFRQQRYRQVLERLQGPLARSSVKGDALSLAARSARQLGRLDQAAGFYRRLLASGRDWRRIDDYLDYADLLVLQGGENDALALLHAHASRLGALELRLHAIDLMARLGRLETAIEHLDELMQQADRKEPWLLRKGNLLARAGFKKRAEACYRQALEAINNLPGYLKNKPGTVDLAREIRVRLASDSLVQQ
jgi:tetratricopeptide (TPR) repeat protein